MSDRDADVSGLQDHSLGNEIVGRIAELGGISQSKEHLARLFLTREHRAAADLIVSWMREAGMRARTRCDRQCLRPL